MGADFFYAAAIHHHDLIGGQNGGKPMGNRDHGSAGGERLQRQLNLLLRFGIESGGGFVEKKDWCVLQNSARDGQSAVVDPRKAAFPCRRRGCRILWLLQDELMCVSHLRGA